MLAAAVCTTARQRHQQGAAGQNVETVIKQPDAQPMADETRRHGVEHLLHVESARGGDGHDRLFKIATAAGRQGLQSGPLGLDLTGDAGILAADDTIDERAVCGKIGKVAVPAQQQGILDRAFEVAMRALDRTVLVRHAAIVAGRFHAVIGAQRVVPAGQVFARVLVEIAKRCRQTVAAMFARYTAQRPQGILQTFRQSDKALPTQNDMRMFKAAIGKPEVIEAVIQR